MSSVLVCCVLPGLYYKAGIIDSELGMDHVPGNGFYIAHIKTVMTGG